MILWDNAIARTSESIAYDAHLSGYAFGIGLMLALLATGHRGAAISPEASNASIRPIPKAYPDRWASYAMLSECGQWRCPRGSSGSR